MEHATARSPAGDQHVASTGEANMSESSPPKLRLVLAGGDSSGRVIVGLESFLHFSHELRCELEALEDRYYSWQRPRSPERGRNTHSLI